MIGAVVLKASISILLRSVYPVDWCFQGRDNPHTMHVQRNRPVLQSE